MIWMMEKVKNLFENYARPETKFALSEFQLVKKGMLHYFKPGLMPLAAKWNLIGFKN